MERKELEINQLKDMLSSQVWCIAALKDQLIFLNLKLL